MKICILRRACRLSEIAGEYGLSEKSLMELNGLERSGLLPRGMSLVLPGKDAAPKRKKELYYLWNKAAVQCPERLSFAAAEFELGDDAQQDTAFLDFASGREALPVYSLCSQGDLPQTRALICDREQGRDFLEALTEKISAMGYGALEVNIPCLLPFDRAQFTDFAGLAAEAAHKRGLWLICTVPLYTEETRYQRHCAAYDAGALGETADRLIVDTGSLMGMEEMSRGLEYMCSFVPAGRLLAAVREGARLYRDGTVEHLSARSAQNLAITAGAEISRRGEGETAQFRFTDKAKSRCTVEYGDSLWAEKICALVEHFSLAGLARKSGQDLSCGTERLFDGYFAVHGLL